MKSRPTVEDVARLSGVSTATVSRVLNAPDQVRLETRQRVTEAVARLGYTPNFRARALASNRSDTIGAIIPTMENAIFARGVQALEEELSKKGVTLLVATSNYDVELEAAQIRALLGRGVDGLFLIGEARPQETYEQLHRHAIPFVLAWNPNGASPHCSVGFDNRAAARRMTERVLNAGHSHVAMIAGVTAWNDRAAARVEGVREALAARGLRLEPGRNLLEADYTLSGGEAATRRFMRLEPRPTAIVCGNDVLAAGALMELRARGLRAPEDVSVVGFDDIDLATAVTPALTTVHVPHRRMGATAAELLLDMARTDEAGPNMVFETFIVERASLAPPKPA